MRARTSTISMSEPERAHHHHAAMVAVASMLGCRVDYLRAGGGSVEIGWNLDAVATDDLEAILAAGYATRVLQGQPEEEAWTRSSSDRARLGTALFDRSGARLATPQLTEHFRRGAASSEAVLRHPAVVRAMSDLTRRMQEAGDGELLLDDSTIMQIVRDSSDAGSGSAHHG